MTSCLRPGGSSASARRSGRVSASTRPSPRGSTIPPYYDSLLAKLIVWDADRPTAIARALRALAEFEVEGVPTTIAAARDILRSDEFGSGQYSTSFLAEAGARLPALAGAA